MNILIINCSETISPGGVHTTIREMATNLSKKHNVTVLQPNLLNLSKEEIYEGFKIIRVRSRFGKYFYDLSHEIYFYLKKHFKELNPDIVHVHGYHNLFWAEIIYLIKKIDPNIPIFLSPHFAIFSHDKFAGKYLWNFYNKIIGKKFISYPNMIIAASNFESDNLNQILNVPKEKIKVIPHGITYKDLNEKNKNYDVVNLLFVGYLLELKGVQYIIEALPELVYVNNLKVCLRIVGDGPYKKELRRLAEKLDVNQFIRWEGFVQPSQPEKLREFYKKSDIFLLLSQSENYGIVVSEALAMGTLTIVTKRTALNEFLDEPGCFGVNYPPDPKEVADLIRKIYESDVQVGPFSKKIRTWDEVVEDYEKIYSDLLKGS